MKNYSFYIFTLFVFFQIDFATTFADSIPITIPEVLRKYMGGKEKIEIKRKK